MKTSVSRSAIVEDRGFPVTIRDQHGKEVNLPDCDVTVTELEQRFHMVKLHLEGNDYSVKFPDKLTGEFHGLKSGVVYTLWGHKWNESLKFKPPPAPDELPTSELMQILKPKFFHDMKQKEIPIAKPLSPVDSPSSSPPNHLNKAMSSYALLDSLSKDKNKVMIVNKKGKQRYYNPKEVYASVLEEEFQLVRTHLEGTGKLLCALYECLKGSDHSAQFPDKVSGKYEQLKLNIVYTIYGHPYNKYATWKPQIRTSSSGASSGRNTPSSSSSLESPTEDNNELVLPNQIPDTLTEEQMDKNRARQEELKEAWLKVTKNSHSSLSDVLKPYKS